MVVGAVRVTGELGKEICVLQRLKLDNCMLGHVPLYVPTSGYPPIESLRSVAYYFDPSKGLPSDPLRCLIFSNSDCVQRMGKGCLATQPGSDPSDTTRLGCTLWMHI